MMTNNNDKQAYGTESQEKQQTVDTASEEKTLNNNAEKFRRREAKRNKEQQRRNALNDGLDVLLDLVFIIDPQLKVQVEQRARASPSRGGIRITASSASSPEHCLLSRVEILEHGISTLQRLCQENEERKVAMGSMAQEIKSLKSGNGGSQQTHPSEAVAAPASTFPPPSNLVASFSNVNPIQGQQFRTPPFASLNTSTPAASLGISLDLLLQARNLASAASLLGTPFVPSNTLSSSLLLPGDSSLYRALRNQKIQEEDSALLAAAATSLIGASNLSSIAATGTLTSTSEASGNPNQDDGTLGAQREQTIAEAAAAKRLCQLGDSGVNDGPAAKRMRRLS